MTTSGQYSPKFKAPWQWDPCRGVRERVKAKAGRGEGRKPYGYFEGEAETLKRIQELRAEGLGYDRIAERLNTVSFREGGVLS